MKYIAAYAFCTINQCGFAHIDTHSYQQCLYMSHHRRDIHCWILQVGIRQHLKQGIFKIIRRRVLFKTCRANGIHTHIPTWLHTVLGAAAATEHSSMSRNTNSDSMHALLEKEKKTKKTIITPQSKQYQCECGIGVSIITVILQIFTIFHFVIELPSIGGRSPVSQSSPSKPWAHVQL